MMPLSWYAHAPGMACAISIRAFTEVEARAKLRAWLGLRRLPQGAAVWERRA